MKRTTAFLFVAIIFFWSCRKHDLTIVPDVPIWQQPKAKQFEYVSANLKLIGRQIAIMAKDRSFREYVKSECLKQSTGDYELPISTLLKSQYGNQLKKTEVFNALLAFANIDGRKYYPQIYLPQPSRSSIKREGDYGSESNPIIVFYDGSEDDEVQVDENGLDIHPAQAYVLNDEGTDVRELDFSVTEADVERGLNI